MIRLQDYVPVEEGTAAAIKSAWTKATPKLFGRVQAAVKANDMAKARKAIDDIDVQSIAQSLEPTLKVSVVTALSFGAMLAQGSDQIAYKNRKLPPVTEPVVANYRQALASIQVSMRSNLPRLFDDNRLEKAASEEGCCEGHHSTLETFSVDLVKAQSLAERLNAVVLGTATSLIDITANLNTSRLVGLGFLDETIAMGLDTYQITAALDGRVCPVCRIMHGKVFYAAKSRQQLLDLLLQTDPAAMKLMAPFPSTSKSNVTKLRGMEPAELQAAGYHQNPYHPGCRCRQVKTGTVPVSQIIPVGVLPEGAELPKILPPTEGTMKRLLSAPLDPKTEAAAPILRKELSDTQLKALDRIFHDPDLNKWLQVCTNPLIQKAESTHSFCSAFNPKQMGQLVSEGQAGVKAWELDDELKAWRVATGDFAQELLDHAEVGSVINDKGFALWSSKNTDGAGTWAKIHVTAAKGTKAVKIGDQYAFPAGTKYQVTKTALGKDGIKTFHVKVLDDVQLTAPIKPSAAAVAEAVSQAPDIVPAGAAANEAAKATLGSDFLDYAKLKKVGAKPGGSVPGAVYQDAEGQKWIVKYVQNDEIARNEVLSGKLYEALGVEVPELRLVKGEQGRTWVASKWLDNFETASAKLQSSERLPGLYDNFAADAWLSNWDVVGASYDNIGLRNGRALRIDIGGALRFRAQGGLKTDAMFPNEVIDIDKMRDPNVSPLVAKVFKDITESELRQGVAKITALPDEKIEQLIRSYGPLDKTENNRLVAKMIARKNDLAERYPKASERPPVLNTTVEAPSTEGISAQEWREIVDARINGRSVRTDFDQIEGQNVLLTAETAANGTSKVVATLKVRGTAVDKLKALTKDAAKGDASAKLEVQSRIEALVGDLDAKLLSWVKGFAMQVSKGEALRAQEIDRFNQMTIAYKQMRSFSMQQGDAIEDLTEAMRKHYSPMFAKARAAMENAKVGDPAVWREGKFLFSPYNTSQIAWPKPKTGSSSSGFSFRKLEGIEWERKAIKNGAATGTGSTLKVWSDAERFVHEANGVKVTWYGPESAAALRNQMTIEVEVASEASADRVFETLKDLGVSHLRATPDQMEHLYLMEMAYLRQATWAKVNGKSLPLDSLRAIVAKDFSLSDDQLRASAVGRRQAYEQGIEYHTRADLQGPAWDKFAKDYRLIHKNTGGGSMVDLVDIVLNSGGRMITTVDKIRRGVPLAGMSPTADLESGGADYFFTRIRKATSVTEQSGTFVFRAEPVRRTTAISYDRDNYGRTDTSDFVQSNRKTTIDQLERASDKSGNETIIKGGLSLFDDLDFIVASSKTERDAIIAKMRAHGLREWPDGRRLDDLVVVRGDRLPNAAPTTVSKPTPALDATPAWAKQNASSYATFKQAGYTEAEVEDIFKDSGLYTYPTPPKAPVQSIAPQDWAYGYEKYVTKWTEQGFSQSQIKAKLASYQNAGDVFPSWLTLNGKVPVAGKELYKTLKKAGYDDPFVATQLQSKGMIDLPPPPPPKPMPTWAKGYAKYYEKWKTAGFSEAEIEKKTAAYAKAKDVFPDWLNLSYKETYKALKAANVSDQFILQDHGYLTL